MQRGTYVKKNVTIIPQARAGADTHALEYDFLMETPIILLMIDSRIYCRKKWFNFWSFFRSSIESIRTWLTFSNFSLCRPSSTASPLSTVSTVFQTSLTGIFYFRIPKTSDLSSLNHHHCSSFQESISRKPHLFCWNSTGNDSIGHCWKQVASQICHAAFFGFRFPVLSLICNIVIHNPDENNELRQLC